MKRFVVIAIILVACTSLAFYLASIRPFAPQAAVRLEEATATPPPPTAEVIPTSSPTQAHTLAPRSSPNTTRAALARETPAILPSQLTDADLTQTAVPAGKTLEAIDARAKATWTPAAGPTAVPRAIDNTINFLLMGSDLRTNDPNWTPATDVIMVVFLDTNNRRAGVLSIPRDLAVAIPHHFGFRVNYVFQYGLKSRGTAAGAELVKQVLHDEFDIRIDHWAIVDLPGFQKMIDTLGGVDVAVPCPLEDTIDEQHFTIPAGNVHMDYITARRYIQSRYTTSDTSRNFRQQRVLWAMVKKGIQLNALDRVSTLWNQLHDSIQTDMTLLDLVSLVPAAYQLDAWVHPERIHARVLEYPAVYPFTSPDGAWLYMPNYQQISDRLNHLFDAPEIAQPSADGVECPPRQPTATPYATPTPST